MDLKTFLKRSTAAFDALFSSVSEQQAMGMDPLQRGLLETTYRALESCKPLKKTSLPA